MTNKPTTNLQARLRTMLAEAINDYELHDQHLAYHDELPRHVGAVRECQAGFELLHQAVDDDGFTSNEIAAEYASLMQHYRQFVVESGSPLRVRVLERLLCDIMSVSTEQYNSHYAR